MPKIQGNTLHVHPVLVFLAVIVGGGLGGIGVIVAVPSLAVGRVLFDFFRVRLMTEDQGGGSGGGGFPGSGRWPSGRLPQDRTRTASLSR